MQEVYKSVLTDSEIAFNTILKVIDPPPTETDVNELPSRGIKLLDNLKFAETSFLFNMCIFTELGNAKNNLILMYALSPSLFELLTTKLSPCNWILAEYFPNIQYSILNRLYSHCSRFVKKKKLYLIFN